MSGIRRAVEEHRKVVSSWCPQTSVWALAHGTTISGLCAAGSSYMVLIRTRQFFNLYSQQYFLGTLLPVLALPSVGCIILQDVFVNRKLINGFSSPETRKSLCSTCLEIRGSFIQTVAGVVAPILFSVSSCASASISYRTFPIPELTNYRKVFGLVSKACGSLSSTLFLLTLVNAMVGGFITEKMVEQHTLISAAQENMKCYRDTSIISQMLRIEPVDCSDCLQVINYLLSEYLGLIYYQIDEGKNVIVTREDTGSEKITEAIDQLKASGIDASLISPEDLVYETDCLPTKRNKHSSVIGNGSDEFVRSVEHLAAVLEPSIRCQRGHNVPAWCINVEPLSSMSSCISMLAQIKPLPNVLGHVKRAFVRQLGQIRVGKVLLGLAGKSFTESDAVNLVSKLCEKTGISRAILRTCRVPLCPPHSCRQQKALSSLIKGNGESRSWPFNFHPNQTLESLLSVGGWEKEKNEGARPYFSLDEIKWHNHWLRRAVDLAKSRSGGIKNASCDLEDPDCVCTCIVIRPHPTKPLDPNEAEPLAEAVSTDAESCIDHATMLAASQVGRFNRELHHLTGEGETVMTGHSRRYLLTDCDVYLSTEPCLMCSMALLHSRVKRVFIARRLHSIGGMCSRWRLPLVKGVNHHFLVFAPREI